MNKFEKLGLSEELLKSINELGFEKPTPIQENIIPVILEGYDVIGQAQTGTGKTLAFSSILLTNLKERKKKPQAYILSPTRELTMQIHEELKKLGKYSSLRFACVYGGSGIDTLIVFWVTQISQMTQILFAVFSFSHRFHRCTQILDLFGLE